MMWSLTMATAARWDRVQCAVFCLGTPTCSIARKQYSFSGGQGFSIGPILRQGWSAAAGATDRLTDTLYDYVPEEVSRSTVRAP